MGDKILVNKGAYRDKFHLYSGRAFESSDSVGKKYKTNDALKTGHVKMFIQVQPNVVPGKMYGLGEKHLRLSEPLDMIYKIYPGEVLALLPELELIGEGENEFQALEDLKCELLDLYDYISNLSEAKLGKGPKAWKKILQRIIES